MTWAVVRVRGSIHAKHDIVLTLKELRLNRPNHVAIIPETPGYRGMANKAQGYVTWGPVSEETLTLLGEARVDETAPPQETRKDGPDAKKKAGEKATGPVATPNPNKLRMYRLKPPRGGWKSTKKPFTLGGALGFREQGAKDDMNALIRRML